MAQNFVKKTTSYQKSQNPKGLKAKMEETPSLLEKLFSLILRPDGLENKGSEDKLTKLIEKIVKKAISAKDLSAISSIMKKLDELLLQQSSNLGKVAVKCLRTLHTTLARAKDNVTHTKAVKQGVANSQDNKMWKDIERIDKEINNNLKKLRLQAEEDKELIKKPASRVKKPQAVATKKEYFQSSSVVVIKELQINLLVQLYNLAKKIHTIHTNTAVQNQNPLLLIVADSLLSQVHDNTKDPELKAKAANRHSMVRQDINNRIQKNLDAAGQPTTNNHLNTSGTLPKLTPEQQMILVVGRSKDIDATDVRTVFNLTKNYYETMEENGCPNNSMNLVFNVNSTVMTTAQDQLKLTWELQQQQQQQQQQQRELQQQQFQQLQQQQAQQELSCLQGFHHYQEQANAWKGAAENHWNNAAIYQNNANAYRQLATASTQYAQFVSNNEQSASSCQQHASEATSYADINQQYANYFLQELYKVSPNYRFPTISAPSPQPVVYLQPQPVNYQQQQYPQQPQSNLVQQQQSYNQNYFATNPFVMYPQQQPQTQQQQQQQQDQAADLNGNRFDRQ